MFGMQKLRSGSLSQPPSPVAMEKYKQTIRSARQKGNQIFVYIHLKCALISVYIWNPPKVLKWLIESVRSAEVKKHYWLYWNCSFECYQKNRLYLKITYISWRIFHIIEPGRTFQMLQGVVFYKIIYILLRKHWINAYVP